MPNDKEKPTESSPGGFVFPDNINIRNMDTSLTRDSIFGESINFSKSASDRTEAINSKDGDSKTED